MAMDQVLDERLEHGALTQPGTPLDQCRQLIEAIGHHIPEPVESIIVGRRMTSNVKTFFNACIRGAQ
jgi:hypothetical protein